MYAHRKKGGRLYAGLSRLLKLCSDSNCSIVYAIVKDNERLCS